MCVARAESPGRVPWGFTPLDPWLRVALRQQNHWQRGLLHTETLAMLAARIRFSFALL